MRVLGLAGPVPRNMFVQHRRCIRLLSFPTSIFLNLQHPGPQFQPNPTPYAPNARRPARTTHSRTFMWATLTYLHVLCVLMSVLFLMKLLVS
jgi:hypothetical protein